MKFLQTKVLMALALLTVGQSALAYTWTFTNVTSDYLVVQVELAGWYNTDTKLGVYFSIVPPGQNTNFSWGFGNPRSGHCLSSIRIAKFSPQLAGYRLKRNAADYQVFHNLTNDQSNGGGQDRLLRHPLRELPITWIPEKTWGMFNQTMQDAAEKLAKGIAKSTEEAITLAIKAAAAYATGGASVAAEEASDTATNLINKITEKTAPAPAGASASIDTTSDVQPKGAMPRGAEATGGIGDTVSNLFNKGKELLGFGGSKDETAADDETKTSDETTVSDKKSSMSVSGLLEPLGSTVGAFMTLLNKSKCMGRSFVISYKKDQLMLFTYE